MPTSSTLTFSAQKLEPAIASNMLVEDAVPLNSGTYTRGTLLGQITTSKLYSAYNNGHADGTEQARCILAYDCVVDSSLNVTITAGTTSEWGQTRRTAPVYLAGYFRAEELTGLDSYAIADLGRLIAGDGSPSGILRVY